MNAQNNDEKPGFWSTLPGILTGFAAVITAIGGLVVGLYQNGIIEHKNDDVSTTISSAPSATMPNQTLTPTPAVQSPSVTVSAVHDATVSIIALDGKSTVVPESSLIYFTGHDFELQDGHTIPFAKIQTADVLETIGNRAKLSLTMLDGSILEGFVQADTFQGDDKFGRLILSIDKIKRVEFKR